MELEQIGLWRYKKMVITELDDIPKTANYFIYKITNLSKNNKVYIGRKALWSKRKKKYGKKKIALMEDKRLKKYEYVIKETNWLTYTGSNNELNEDIASGDKISREILHFCENKAQTTYQETKYQFIYEVLENDNSYNRNILGRFYSDILFPN